MGFVEPAAGMALVGRAWHKPTQIGWGGQTGIWTFLDLIDGRPYKFTSGKNYILSVGKGDFRMAHGQES